MLFTDHERENIYKSYVDAILEVKAKYPVEFQGAKEEEKSMDDLTLSFNPTDPTLRYLS